MQKSKTVQLRKWHFLFLGGALVALALFLWYWNWRKIGLPSPLQPEHITTILSYVVGILILSVFIYRLTKTQVTVMLVWLVIANVVTALVSIWVFRTYPDFFEVMRPMVAGAGFDAAYVADWKRVFLTPVIYAMQIGLLLLWAESLVMFLVRKPGDEPG